MNQHDTEQLLVAIDRLGKTGDFVLDNYIDLARGRLLQILGEILWQNREDEKALFERNSDIPF